MKQVNPLIVKTAEELNQKPCKFKIGDIVNTKPNLYGETEGVVTSVKRIYAEVFDGTDKFIPKGLCTEEDTIYGIYIPFTFDGETLTITQPEDKEKFQRGWTRISKFKGWVIHVKSPKMNTIFSEKSVKLK